MKTIFKIKYVLLAVIALLAITSCEKEDYLIFTAAEPVEKVAFVNEFNEAYKISPQTSSNILERLVWNTPDFGAPNSIIYTVDVAGDTSFGTTIWQSGEIKSQNHVAIPTNKVIEHAEKVGLDFDPNTTDSNGNPNNMLTAYVRVTAHAGSTTGGNAVTSVSETKSLSIELIEAAGACVAPASSNWGLVGDAVNNWGGDNQGYAATNDVELLDLGDGRFVGIVSFVDGFFKFRQDGGWTVNLGDTTASNATGSGSLKQDGENIPVTAGTYVVSIDTVENKYSISAASVVWGIVGSGAHNGWGGPNLKMYADPCNDGVFLAKGVALVDGEIKFRQDDGWTVNLGDTSASNASGEGSLKQDGENIPVTAGTYDITLDTVNNTYSIK